MSQAIRAQDIIEFSDGKNPVPTPKYGRIVGTAFLLSAKKYAELMLNFTAMRSFSSAETRLFSSLVVNTVYGQLCGNKYQACFIQMRSKLI